MPCLWRGRNWNKLTAPSRRLSPLFVFDQTAYYADEMGADLRKQFFAFHDLIAPERLPDVKLHTNALEREMARIRSLSRSPADQYRPRIPSIG